MKKITDLKLVDWQQYLDQFVCEKPNKSDSPVAMRIDGTQLSIMRFFGGGTFKGERYVTFYDKSAAGEFTCEYATIAVRWDFHKWVLAKIREENRKARELENSRLPIDKQKANEVSK